MNCLKSKSTDDLQEALLSAPNLDRFLEENVEKFHHEDRPAALSRMFESKNMSKAALAKNSGMSSVYLHQVFSGRRNPSRNRLICICLGMSATLEETQDLLKHSGMGLLYIKDRRDAIITYGLVHKQTLFEVNDKLFSENEETLY